MHHRHLLLVLPAAQKTAVDETQLVVAASLPAVEATTAAVAVVAVELHTDFALAAAASVQPPAAVSSLAIL